jgi:hypothetical protein
MYFSNEYPKHVLNIQNIHEIGNDKKLILLNDVQIKCTRKCTSRMQYNGGASARSNPQGIVFLKANLNLTN